MAVIAGEPIYANVRLRLAANRTYGCVLLRKAGVLISSLRFNDLLCISTTGETTLENMDFFLIPSTLVIQN